jgi:hypothetical protein
VPNPKTKELPVEFLDRPRRAIYGQPELLALCKITKVDPFRGQYWADSISIENVSQVLHVLLKRDDPNLTLEGAAALWGPEDIKDIVNLAVQLQTGKTLDEIEALSKEKVEIPLLATPPDSKPSVN